MQVKKSPSRSPISIHALRGEGDDDVGRECPCVDISIHALRGEGDGEPDYEADGMPRFLSTPSVGRATPGATHPRARRTIISIHALRGEGDCKSA